MNEPLAWMWPEIGGCYIRHASDPVARARALAGPIDARRRIGHLHGGPAAIKAAKDDRATAVFVGMFYDEMLKSGHPPATALREAPLALRAHPRWKDPFYWGALVAQGEWN